ncbi:rhs element Vgr protein [Actinoplanes sp. SE50]|uniref:VgrG-related protein n=1 Tax=unclassified Actinoplanes TaxID=2626549 RepID=UPI00023EC771|nr:MULTISPECIES: VgrG-related protein [unclassified Actinoplanes]AEV83112.1 rhs element Vgr protein [Actinoplanes sp. SE50/110]ATO81508.1 rhs element Vgr protein [Actinoplanes sp. SE50]SLL98915.1 Rhs element Vgr protein [Actinoplanes sp. SE50/110]
MTADRGLDTVAITVDGAPLPTSLYPRLIRVRVQESIHLPDQFTIRFEDAHFQLFDQHRFRPGTRVEIAFRSDADPVVVTSGEVTTVEVAPGVSGRHELVLTGLDLAHRLARGPRTRSFTGMSDGDVAARIAADHGLDADVDATGAAQDYVLQIAETDLAFLRGLAARTGFDVWVTGGTLHFKRRPSSRVTPPPMRWGDNLLDFSARFASAEHCDEVVVTAWDPVEKRTVTGRAAEPEYGTDAPAAAQSAEAARGAFGRTVRRTGQVPASGLAEAEAYARSLLSKASGSEVVLRGLAKGNPLIAAGARVQLERVGQRLAGGYRVTSAEHDFGAGGPYLTRFVCGTRDAGELADLLRPAPGAEPRSLISAVVTSNADPEKLGRVRVRFPTLSEQDESAWARVVTPGGGPGRGMQWLPEVEDEVLVGFELDDRTRPYVLGGLFNRRDVPPDPDVARDGAATRRVLASRCDHRLTFDDDSPGAVELALSGGDSALRLTGDESALRVAGALKVTGRTIEIAATDRLVLRAPTVEITADAELRAAGRPIRLN